MLVRREAIAQVGLMDERYFMYAEEADWCYRFAQSGWKMTFTPVAEIIHLSSQSSAQCWPKMYVWQHKSTLLFLEKWRSAGTRRVANLVFIASSLLRAQCWLLLGFVGIAQEEAGERRDLAVAALRFHLTGAVPE